METEYKNYFSEEVFKNKVIINKLSKIFKSMKKEDFLVVSNDKYKGYMYEDKDNKSYYLILETREITGVYTTEKSSYSKPFEKAINGDLDSLKYYASHIISIFNSKEIEEEINKELEERLNMFPENLTKHMREYVRENFFRANDFSQQTSTSNTYVLKTFLEFLENNDYTSEFDKEFLYKNTQLYEKVQTRVAEFGLVLEATKEGLKQNNITEKNKFEYNDLDNHIWKNGQYIVSTEQNFSWVTDFVDQKNFTVYAALSPHNGNGSKAKSTTGLLKKIKSGEKLDSIDYVGLCVENGKVIYANNAFMYSVDFNILLNKNVLEEEGLLKVDYGTVDINSFDYQFAFSNKQYGTNKVDFLVHALFVLGNGFTYNADNGRIYSKLKYIPDLLDNFEYAETTKDKEKITSMVYLAPPKLTYLDDVWLDNLKYIVEKIKTDKPDLSKTHTRDSSTPKQVLKELDKVIQYNENLRKHKPNI